MKIATWNVNSIRIRLLQISNWIQKNNINILAIQETKIRNYQFPKKIFNRLGYDVCYIGHDQWNGVAIISNVGISNIEYTFIGQPKFKNQLEARFISAICNNIKIINIYVPNGRNLLNEHMTYKIEWLSKFLKRIKYFLLKNLNERMMILGDWNIAPYDRDVWNVKYFKNKTHVSKNERIMFFKFIKLKLFDITNLLSSSCIFSNRFVNKKMSSCSHFTYWDYRFNRFLRNQGMRIDIALTNENLFRKVNSWTVDTTQRHLDRPSDHAPLIIELND